MRMKFITLTFILISIVSVAQSQTNKISPVQQKQPFDNAIYQLFPTKNYWTFIKLDTRNGKMWQLHFGVGDDKNTGELILNAEPLVSEANEINGRFTLYPTENMYNFLLLDQIAGIVVQVQWSAEAKNRGIVSVILPID